MPIHDWTRVDAGLFHAFHHSWITALSAALNGGVLPPNYFALPEQVIRGPIPDVLALKLAPKRGSEPAEETGGVAVATAPPKVGWSQRIEGEIYAGRANRIAVRHRHGQIVAVVEIVSPGNKLNVAALRAFVQKAADLIQQGVHLLVIDLFPPTKRDPDGIHKSIWDEFEDQPFERPASKPLTVSAYDSGPDRTAYVEFAAVGDQVPDMPLFLRPEHYVLAPLDATYAATWAVFPAALKGLLEGDA